MATIQKVHQDISDVENRFNVANSDEVGNKERLNFGLVEVVYEWARNKVLENYSCLCRYCVE